MLARTGAAFGDLGEQPIDILRRNLGDLALAQFRLDQLAQERGLVGKATGSQIDRVFSDISVDQVGRGWRMPELDPLPEGIVASVDLALEPLCLFARSGNRPVGPGTDREAAIAAGDAIAEEEAALAGAQDVDAEAGDLVVVDEQVAAGIRHHRLHRALGQMLLHACH
jgi:hypothetical protein